jgi:hypothetical protein
MSEKYKSGGDSVGAVFLVCVTVLILAFAGDPDLLDGIIAHLGGSHG